MNILSLDFSTDRRVAAVACQGEVRAWVMQETGRRIFPWQLVGDALNQAKLNPGEIDAIALGLGPGSYTGIRTSISIAQGWHLAKGIPCHGFCSMTAIRPVVETVDFHRSGRLLVYAQRNEYFHLSVESALNPTCDPAMEIEIFSHSEVLSMGEKGGATLFGPGMSQRISTALDAFPDPTLYCQPAEGGQSRLSPECLEPLYIRETSFVKSEPPRDLSKFEFN